MHAQLLHPTYLFEVVEAVHHGGLGRGELGQDVKQLHHHILLVVDDGQVEGTGRKTSKHYIITKTVKQFTM